MNSNIDPSSELVENLNAESVRFVDELCDRFELAWREGTPDLTEFLELAPAVCRDYLFGELVGIELHYRRDAAGNALPPDALLKIYPQLPESFRVALEQRVAENETLRAEQPMDLAVDSASDVVLASDYDARGLHIRCPHCREPVELLADTPNEEVSCQTCGSAFSLVDSHTDAKAAPSLQAIGRFELIARLGVGGFGTVWKARDTELDRVVALKIPRKGNLQPEEIDHFFREARAAAQLRHPHIVSVYEIGREEDTIFIVSDYVQGVTLADWMSGSKPGTKEIARLGAILAEALQHAHDHGVIHRDLKPSNIMIDDHGQPYIMDFGLAKRQSGEVTMTVDGQILGTAAYMSPEQAGGQSHWTDCRADIYSLGVVLFQLATGELPFRGSHEMHLYHKQIEDAPELTKFNRYIAQDFSTICMKCLERDPNRRYSKATKVADELRRFVRGEPIRARPISKMARVGRWAKRKPALAAALSLTGFIAIAGPIAAVTIALQGSELRSKSVEQIAIIAQDQKVKRDLAQKNLQLIEQLELLRGTKPGVMRNAEGWQRQLIMRIVETRYADADALLAAKQRDYSERAKLHSALGFMYAELGRNAQAIGQLQLAKSALQQLLQQHPHNRVLLAGMAECSETIARLAEDTDTIDQAVSEQLQIRQQLAEAGGEKVPDMVDLLAAEWQAADLSAESTEVAAQLGKLAEIERQLLANWPTSPAEIYQAACRLTLRRAPLLEAVSTAEPRP